MSTERTLAIFLFFILSIGTRAQSDSLLDNFSVNTINGKIILTWEIKAGMSCNGTQILRSTDGINFVEIGDIQGVCGAANSSVRYNFTDNNPVNTKINYYKLKLGTFGYTAPLSIEFINITGTASYVKPNPVVSYTDIYFSNPDSESLIFILYNQSGQEVMRVNNISDDKFRLERNNFDNGIYFYRIIKKEGILTSGKLIFTSR